MRRMALELNSWKHRSHRACYNGLHTYIRTHTHTHLCIYIYIYAYPELKLTCFAVKPIKNPEVKRLVLEGAGGGMGGF